MTKIDECGRFRFVHLRPVVHFRPDKPIQTHYFSPNQGANPYVRRLHAQRFPRDAHPSGSAGCYAERTKSGDAADCSARDWRQDADRPAEPAVTTHPLRWITQRGDGHRIVHSNRAGWALARARPRLPAAF